MKFREIFRFELGYQMRCVSTWLYFAVLFVFAFISITELAVDARLGGFFVNSPFVIAVVAVTSSSFWLLVATAVAGNAAARDVQTQMHLLIYTAPVRKAEYLGGRFLAAFVLNALILLAVPAGILLALHSPGVEPEILGPFWPAAHLSAYVFIALPNAFVATAIQFSSAALNRRSIASYLGSVVLLLAVLAGLAAPPPLWELGKLLDPIGLVAILGDLGHAWTPIEKNTRLVLPEGTRLWNRLLWLGIALGTLAVTHRRFRFDHYTASTWWRRITQPRDALVSTPTGIGIVRSTPTSVPPVLRAFGFPTHARQTLAVAWGSFRTIARSASALVFSAAIAMLAGVFLGDNMGFMGVPLVARADLVLTSLTTPVAGPGPWILIPLLIVFWAGELVWREREAGLSAIIDAAPVPGWVFFLGKFLGLGLVLVASMALLMTVGMLVQVSTGSSDLEIWLYLQILFGLELAEYLLLALFVLAVCVVVNQKNISRLVVLVTLFLIAAAYGNEIGHTLLIPGADPGWSYTDMRGFGPSLGPWLWFKLYWTAWALLLAVVARLSWVRGSEGGLRARIRTARRRFTNPTAWTAAGAAGLVLASGGFVFYNTNVLNDYRTAAERMERRAEYERRYGQYDGIPQPRMTGTELRVELHPDRRALDVQGTYHLVNDGASPIDSIHLATEVEPEGVDLDRSATLELEDEDLGHRIFALAEPLQPGDSLRLDFEMHVEPHGFGIGGIDAPVAANGTWFTNLDWFPAIGYQPQRQLRNAGERRAHGLAPRPILPSVYDVDAHPRATGAERIAFEAVVGTDEDQVAVAPGALRRTWTEGGRRYFHYVTEAPIGHEYAFFSADYAVHEGRWNDVAIEILHHPEHTANLDRMVRSVQASLSHYTEQFGPYPYGVLRLIERPGLGFGMHSDAIDISYEEGTSLLNPRDGPRGLDLPFYVVAHEVAHQWWGAQLTPAYAEGAGVLVESLASYSAYQVVERTYGHEHLRRIFGQLRLAYQVPRARAADPLLRAKDSFLYYRKGPFALYALSRYIGQERVNGALRRLLDQHGSGTPPLPTSLDLHRELQAITPDSYQTLLHDLFEVNTFWDLETERATAEPTEAGTWQVTLDVRARKVVVDSAGVETPVPMDDWVEVGVFAPAENGEESGEPLYEQMHRVRSAEQTITVTVPRKPARAGIDPYHLLIDWEMDDNTEDVRVKS